MLNVQKQHFPLEFSG